MQAEDLHFFVFDCNLVPDILLKVEPDVNIIFFLFLTERWLALNAQNWLKTEKVQNVNSDNFRVVNDRHLIFSQ